MKSYEQYIEEAFSSAGDIQDTVIAIAIFRVCLNVMHKNKIQPFTRSLVYSSMIIQIIEELGMYTGVVHL